MIIVGIRKVECKSELGNLKQISIKQNQNVRFRMSKLSGSGRIRMSESE